MEHQQYKTIKAYWTALPTVLFLLSGILLLVLGLNGFPGWFLKWLLGGLLIGTIIVEHIKCRCPYCHSIKVTGCYHAKGSMEQCPKCKHLIYYD